MKRILIFLFLISGFIFFSCSDDEKETTTVVLQTDGFDGNGNTVFVEAVNIGEEYAITLGPADNSFDISNVSFLFGGTGNNTVEREIKLNIYKDNGSVNPGSLLFSENFNLVSSNTLMQQIDLSDKNINVDGGGSIRVSFEFLNGTGFPSLAQELNGTYFNTKNWIKDPDGTWHSNDGLGINGNWVLRATIEEEI